MRLLIFALVLAISYAQTAKKTLPMPKGAQATFASLFEVAVGTCTDGWSGCTGWLQYCGGGWTMRGSGQSLDDYCCATCSGTDKPTMMPTVKKVVDESGGDSGGDSEAGSFQQVLDRHNVYRCMHGIPLLKWNTAIAMNAQTYADTTGGKMVHSSSESRSGIGGFSYLGENLAKGTTSSRAVDLWYNEIDLTSPYGLVSSFTSGTGHYTQVVWAETTDLGCGVKDDLIVCQYGIGGNMQGAFEKNVNAPTKDRSECESTSSEDHFLGSCDQCLYTSQCPVDYYCCPYMKKCVKGGNYPCYYPIANCRPTCGEGSPGYPDSCTCANPDFPNNWVKKSEELALASENQKLKSANKALRQALKQMQHE